MATLGLILALGGLLWLAVRITRRQIALGELTEALAAEHRLLVAVDPASGQLLDATSELPKVEASWHPVRFPEGWESRSAGFPAERAGLDRNLDRRRRWCEQHCTRRWRVERPSSPGPVFWFEDRRDAVEFSLAWFPFKCS
ncbi:MAG TPA: hypothetical protein VIR38_01550 [Thalassobaculum sp.]